MRRGAEDHPPVRNVRPFPTASNAASVAGLDTRTPVPRPAEDVVEGSGSATQRKRHASPGGQREQARQQPVVAVLGDEQVGVGPFNEPDQFPQEVRPVLPKETLRHAVDGELERADAPMRRVPRPFHPEERGRKGGMRRVDVPRRIEHPGGTDRPVAVAVDDGARQGVQSGRAGELLLRRDVGVAQRLRAERLFRLSDRGSEEDRGRHGERPRRDRPARKEVDPLPTDEVALPPRGGGAKGGLFQAVPREDERGTKRREEGDRLPGPGAEPDRHPARRSRDVEDPSDQSSLHVCMLLYMHGNGNPLTACDVSLHSKKKNESPPLLTRVRVVTTFEWVSVREKFSNRASANPMANGLSVRI